jgi:TonB family protein
MTPGSQAQITPTSRRESDYITINGPAVSLRISAAALRDIQTLVLSGLKALHGHSLEMGGVLLGTRAAEIQIEGVEAVEIGYHSGPTYQPAAEDLPGFTETLSRHAGDGPKVIGYFRGQTRGDFEIRSADQEITGRLGEAGGLLLLVRSVDPAPLLARLYRRVGRDWVGLVEFPLAPGESGMPSSAASPSAVRPAARPSLLQRWLVPASAGLLSFALSAGYFALHPVQGPPAPIGLQAHAALSNLVVTWDRGSPAVVSGVSGVLIIEDGPHKQFLQLSPEQVRTGSVSYLPETEQVNLRLALHIATGVSPAGPKPAAAPAAPSGRSEAHREAPDFDSPTAGLPALASVSRMVPASSAEQRSYTAPAATRRVNPSVPRAVSAKVLKDVTVEVRATIDARGKVTKASAISASGAAQKLVAPYAVKAARQWQFTPASRNGRKVPGQAVLRFEFARAR